MNLVIAGNATSLMNVMALSKIGNNAVPNVSFASSNPICIRAILPAYVSAFAAAAPPNKSVNFPCTSVNDIVFNSAADSPMPSLPNDVDEPSYALPNAFDMVSNGLPVAAEMSIACANNFCACSESPVARAKRAKLGRKSSSATPDAKLILRIAFSVDAIWSSVAPVEFFNANANCVCAFSSAIAALTASVPMAIAAAPAAAAAAANANPTALPVLLTLSPNVSTSFEPAVSDLFRLSTSPKMESLRVREPPAIMTNP